MKATSVNDVQELETLLAAKEGPVEFKEAKERFSFDELTDYCVALANEGGGKVILGVTDKRPRKVVGTKAFAQPERGRAVPSCGLDPETLRKHYAGKRPNCLAGRGAAHTHGIGDQNDAPLCR